MRGIEEFVENLKSIYNFPNVKWCGRTLAKGHKIDISLSEQHKKIIDSKADLFKHYALQAKMCIVEKSYTPISQIGDVCCNYDYDKGHLIIEGSENNIKEFLFQIFTQQN